MPIYEYECDKCGAHLEVLQKMGDKALTRCTKCRGRVRKVVSRSSFQLKGSGWYMTDYAKPGSSKSTTETKTETKTETNTEAKSEAKPASTACGPTGCGNCD